MIPYGRQDISDADIAAVTEILRSDFLTQGPAVPAFEENLAHRCQARFGVAVNSATSALHLAYRALGVGPGDRVWTSPITFVATANAALYCGAKVDFVDIDPDTYNISPDDLARKLKIAADEGTLPKVITAVHLAGQSCDMARISDLARSYDVQIVEDASHAVGALYRGEPIGNCQYSDITVFSFHPVKIITTGEGGMALTNDPALRQSMAMGRSHGIVRDPAQLERSPDGPWYYEQQELGFNYRLSDISAALGISQLGRLDEFLSRRHAIADRYNRELADLALTLPHQHADTRSSWHLYLIGVQEGAARSRRDTFEFLRQRGINVNLHYMPVYLQPYYARLGFRSGLCPHAEAYYAQSISLPIHPSLSDTDQQTVIDALRDAVSS